MDPFGNHLPPTHHLLAPMHILPSSHTNALPSLHSSNHNSSSSAQEQQRRNNNAAVAAAAAAANASNDNVGGSGAQISPVSTPSYTGVGTTASSRFAAASAAAAGAPGNHDFQPPYFPPPFAHSHNAAQLDFHSHVSAGAVSDAYAAAHLNSFHSHHQWAQQLAQQHQQQPNARQHDSAQQDAAAAVQQLHGFHPATAGFAAAATGGYDARRSDYGVRREMLMYAPSAAANHSGQDHSDLLALHQTNSLFQKTPHDMHQVSRRVSRLRTTPTDTVTPPINMSPRCIHPEHARAARVPAESNKPRNCVAAAALAFIALRSGAFTPAAEMA